MEIITSQTAVIMIAEQLTVEKLVVQFESGQLADQDDATLHEAVRTLEEAEQHFFDGLPLLAITESELATLRERKHYLTKVVNGILKLLLLRYGCND